MAKINVVRNELDLPRVVCVLYVMRSEIGLGDM
jgi:hypothetical protein